MTFFGKLYSFQEEAVERMISRKFLLVAFDMGLGKTVLTIAAVEQLIDEGKVAGGFIVCSRSLKYQWRNRIQEFTNGEANILVVDGGGEKRQRTYREYFAGGYEYLILNIEQIVNDWDIVSKLPRDFIALDEAQSIKNFKPRRSKQFKKLQAHYKWALTGQPIENRGEDAFSIMQWVDPEVLGNWEIFDETFIKRKPWGQVSRYVNLSLLHETLSTAMVRKTRAEVADQLPSVVEESLLIDFDPAGANLYRIIGEELLQDWEESEGGFGSWDAANFYEGGSGMDFVTQGKITSKRLCLRMLCDHPELLRISAGHFEKRNSGRFQGIRAGSAYAHELWKRGLLDRLKNTPKLDATEEEIETILEASPDNKIVLFSFFKDMLKILQDKYPDSSVVFTGDTSTTGRDEAIQRFASDPRCRIFLSSDAGGAGLDLPMANYLISYDLPQSAGAWRQRNGRIDRLSSKFPVITQVSMLMSESIEERQYDSVQLKGKIGEAVVDGKFDKSGILKMDLQSLNKFLRERVV